MSSTRHAENGSPFRQEKYCSSPEFERGLMGNLVAKRCEVLEEESDRSLIWFIQHLSHAAGGLQKLSADLMERFCVRIASRSMQTFGFDAGQIYDAEKTRIVRHELDAARSFPLQGEMDKSFVDVWEQSDECRAQHQARAENSPAHYPAADFVAWCQSAAKSKLPTLLAELCLNPDPLIGCAPAYFPDLVQSLREYQTAWTAERSAAAVVTSLGRIVYETLDYALSARRLVLIDGLPRTGKTFAVKAWCELHPGQARYAQCPSSNDDIGFFKAIARALGVSINQNSKAQQLRDRVEEVLHTGHLVLVLDEAHYLWPQSNYRSALPGRVDWIMTALVNHGVPVALVTTPQFMRSQKDTVRKTQWTSGQFTGRIGAYEQLPDSLTAQDFEGVARSLLPEGCKASIEALVCYGRISDKYLAAIDISVARARFLARKSDRANVTFADINQAIKGSAIPSDKGLALALAEPKQSGRSRTISPPMPSPSAPAAAPAHRETEPPKTSAPDRGLKPLAPV